MQAKNLFLISGVILLLAACASKTTVESDLGISGAPDWVNEGTQYLNDKDGRLFHGVGQAPAMGDESLQISTADNRARAEVARILTSYLDVVSNDYTSASGSGDKAINQQAVSQQISNLSKINLSGAKIIGHWKDDKTGTIYSIAELDLSRVKDITAQVKDMNADLKRYIIDNSNNIFDKMAQEKK
ncbi:MAG: hypothetical protein LJE74_06930 [Proteobacteria bacterium]|jgi:hypothetical protein|nr:hypothetical protein [Pseudomonadota bacterium]